MQVRDIMTRQLASCRPDADVQEVASLMVQCDCGAIPVVEPQSHKAIGVVTDRDIVCRAVAAGRNPVGMKAEQVIALIGAPDTKMRFDAAHATAWGYDFRDTWGYDAEFSVTVGDDGIVRSTFTGRHDA